MSAWEVEKQGRKILEPYLEEKSNGKYVVTDKGRLSYELQKTVGDALCNTENGEIHGVEFKIEKRYTGNLFLEIFSNKKFGWSNPGWMLTLKADWIWYYFLNEDRLLIIDFKQLYEWAFGDHESCGNIWRYKEKAQYEHDQLNVTCGRIVPIDDLKKTIRISERKPKEELKLIEV